MEFAWTAKIARAGTRLLRGVAWLLIAVLLLYGGYSLWDTARILQGGFVSNELLQYKPTQAENDSPTLAQLQAINPDVVGWLTIDGTHIDYPLLQGEDDMEYVNKDVYGAFSFSGAIFLDSTNSSDCSDPYCLIYGHHMDNGAMFGDVVEFTQSDYFDSHQRGTLYVNGEARTIELFACAEADAYDTVFYHPAEQSCQTVLQHIEQTAVQSRAAETGSQIIALSTCAQAETNGRVLLFGWLTDQKGGADER